MEINTTIKDFILSELLTEQGNSLLGDTEPLIDSGIIDSFGIMALMGFLEEEFSINITGDDLVPENFESIVKISALVAKKTRTSMESLNEFLLN